MLSDPVAMSTAPLPPLMMRERHFRRSDRAGKWRAFSSLERGGREREEGGREGEGGKEREGRRGREREGGKYTYVRRGIKEKG